MRNFVIQHTMEGIEASIASVLESKDVRDAIRNPLLRRMLLVGAGLPLLAFVLFEPLEAIPWALGTWVLLWILRPRPSQIMLKQITGNAAKVRWYTSAIQIEIQPDGLHYDSGETRGVLRWPDAEVHADGPAYLFIRGAPAGHLCFPFNDVPMEALDEIRSAISETRQGS